MHSVLENVALPLKIRSSHNLAVRSHFFSLHLVKCSRIMQESTAAITMCSAYGYDRSNFSLFFLSFLFFPLFPSLFILFYIVLVLVVIFRFSIIDGRKKKREQVRNIKLLLATIIIVSQVSHLFPLVDARSNGRGKKKVVIIGEMSDMVDLIANETSSYVEPYYEDDDVSYDTDYNHNRFRRGHRVTRRKRIQNSGDGSGGSLFVPVAAYSITKSKTHPNSYRKRQGGPGGELRMFTNF